MSESKTPRTHELKTDAAVFDAVARGLKTYELRKNDRGFFAGDELILRETRFTGAEMASGAPLEYTGRVHVATVTHMLTGPIYGLAAGWSILSLGQSDLTAAQARIAELEAERERLRKDAERMQWVRKNIRVLKGTEYSRIMGQHVWGSWDKIDAAIDAAIAAKEKDDA